MNKYLTKTLFVIVSILLMAFTSDAIAYARINIVTSTPDLANIAGIIGGDKVTVTSLAKGYQDPHFVEPKPSFMLLLKKADLYLVMGMSLETGWSPPLEQGSRNSDIMRGGKGYIDCSRGIRPLEVPVGGTDRSMGDVHPNGNPHYQLDPENGIIIARNITNALKRRDPANSACYSNNLKQFIKDIRQAETRWLATMKPYRGLKIVTDHNMWSYFARRFGLNVVGTIEPKPGISPSPAHISRLIRQMKEQNVRLIIRTPYFAPQVPDMVARDTGARAIVLPPSVGGIKGIDNYFQLFDYLTKSISETARSQDK